MAEPFVVVPAKAEMQRAQVSLARIQPLSSPRRRGPITTRVSVIAGSPTLPCCGVWVPACAGTTAESHCFTFAFAGTTGGEFAPSVRPRHDHPNRGHHRGL